MCNYRIFLNLNNRVRHTHSIWQWSACGTPYLWRSACGTPYFIMECVWRTLIDDFGGFWADMGLFFLFSSLSCGVHKKEKKKERKEK